MMTNEILVDVSQDWLLACDVQQRFMESLGGNARSVDYGARCRQARALGGDCYDFIALTDDHLALVIGDASGKGLAAALMIANVQASLRAAALFIKDDLVALFKVVNELAYASSLADRYATLFFGVFDKSTRRLRYVNAGHNDPIVLRQDGSLQWLEAGGAPVGMFPDSEYKECFIQLEAGDLVLAYTDGVIEAVDPSGEEWGVQGLLNATAACRAGRARNAEDLVQLIFQSMDNFTESHQTDDATLAVVRVA
jgi:sigma-B regulation protein RsbU (phosphoserine phosphatase)